MDLWVSNECSSKKTNQITMIDGSSPYILILILIFKSSEWFIGIQARNDTRSQISSWHNVFL